LNKLLLGCLYSRHCYWPVQ